MPQTGQTAKRVLIVAVDFKPLSGGIAEFAYHIARGFMALDADVQILSPYYSGIETNDDCLGLQIKRTYPPLKPGRVLSVREKICKCISLASLAKTMLKTRKLFRPHVIYLPSMYPFAGLFPYSGGVLVTTFHGGELSVRCNISRLAFINRYVLKRSCRHSSLILANSNYNKEVLQNFGVAASKIFVTGCGVDWDIFASVPDTEYAKSKLGFSGKRIILSLGRLDERKGFDSVLRCIPGILRKFPDALYVIAGRGPMKAELEKLVPHLGLQNYVRFVGQISHESVVHYMAACDIFAMPYRETARDGVEGFGIVLLEANCCGKPVVAGRSGGVIDAVEHYKTGILVDPYNLKDIEDALVKLLEEPDLAARLGCQGRQRVEQHFKWKTIAERACRRVLGLTE